MVASHTKQVITIICLGIGAVLLFGYYVATEAVTQAISIAAYALAISSIVLLLGISVYAIMHLYHLNKIKLADVAKAQAEAEKAKAEAEKVKRDAEVYVINTGNQIHIRDSNPNVIWRAAHLDGRIYSDTPPQTTEQKTWLTWNIIQNAPKKMAEHLLPQTITHQPQTIELPPRVNLETLIPGGASLNQIMLGLTTSPHQGIMPLTAPLSRLVHVGIGGSSGWGKSVFMQSIAYQLSTAIECGIQLALIDLERTTFDPFANSPRLRYAVVDDEVEAFRIINDLIGEMTRRKDLYAQLSPMPHDLEKYNQLSTKPLPYIALMIDESTALLENKDLEGLLRTITLKARKFGIFAIMGGQDWKASSLSTTIRNQFSTRVQFKALDSSQSRVLLHSPDAVEITIKGRGYAIIPGRDRIEFQAPYINPDTIIEHTKPPTTVPMLSETATSTPPPAAQPTPREKIVVDMYEAGASYNQISKRLNNGRTGGEYNKEIKKILRQFQLLKV